MDAVTCSTAATDGHLNCLKYLYANSSLWDVNTPALAAPGGQFELPTIAHEHTIRLCVDGMSALFGAYQRSV